MGATEENIRTTDIVEGRLGTLGSKAKEQIIREMHESAIGGHNGMNRTHHRIRHCVSWEGMKNDIENCIRICVKCQQNKLTQRKNTGSYRIKEIEGTDVTLVGKRSKETKVNINLLNPFYA